MQLNEAYIALFHKVLSKQLYLLDRSCLLAMWQLKGLLLKMQIVFFLAVGSRLDGNVCLPWPCSAEAASLCAQTHKGHYLSRCHLHYSCLDLSTFALRRISFHGTLKKTSSSTNYSNSTDQFHCTFTPV